MLTPMNHRAQQTQNHQFFISTSFVPKQLILSLLTTVCAEDYRSHAQGMLQQLVAQSAASKSGSAGKPFAIFHDLLNIDGMVYAEICLPIVMRRQHPEPFRLRTLDATAVARARVTIQNGSMSVEPLVSAVEAVEEYILAADHVFAGDPREIFPSTPDGPSEVQIPII